LSKNIQLENEHVKDLEMEISSYKDRIQFLESQIADLKTNPATKVNGKTSSLLDYSKSQHLIEYAFYPSAIIDKKNNILNANKQFERSFGYSLKELSQLNIDILIPEISINARKNFNLKFQKDNDNRLLGKQSDLLAIHKSGKEIPVEVGVSYIKNEKGYEILATVIDVSERKSIEKSLLKTIERLDLSLSGGGIGV